MSTKNKDILLRANAAVSKGDYEGFLAYCTEDVEWVFVGEQTLRGKDAVRRYIKESYIQPPTFSVDQMIAEGDSVAALGNISIKDADGTVLHSAYCDVWQIRDGKLAKLRAFVVSSHSA